MVMEDERIINVTGAGVYAGMSPMHIAASEGLDRVAALLLRQNIGCRLIRNKVGRDPMHVAVIAGSVGVVKALYDGEHFLTDIHDCLGCTSLHYAAFLQKEHCSEMMHLLVRLCNFDVAKGITLLTATERMNLANPHSGHEESERQLAQAEKHMSNINQSLLCANDTALHIASNTGNDHATQCLLQLGANSRAINSDKKTPLHCAMALAQDSDDILADGSHHHIFKMLLANGAKVNAIDTEGRTVLHVGAEANAVQALAYLMLHTHVDVRAKDVKGRTPLHTAVAFSNVRCVDIIQGSFPETLDDVCFQGNSALHVAVQLQDWQQIVKVLLEFRGIDAELRNNEGKTAQDLAIEMGRSDLADQLQNYIDVEQRKAVESFNHLETQHQCAIKIQQFYQKKVAVSHQKTEKGPHGHLPPLTSTSIATSLSDIEQDSELQRFVNQFAGQDAGEFNPLKHAKSPSPLSLEQTDYTVDPVTVVKEFLERFASRANFDRFIAWRKKGHVLDPPLNKATMGCQDMISLLEKVGLMDQLVSRPEIYTIFCSKAPGQSKTVSKEITYSVFRLHMRNLAIKAQPGLLDKFLSEPEVLHVAGNFSVHSNQDSSDDDDMDSNSGKVARYPKRDKIDPNDYVPTITGVNSPACSVSRGLSSRFLKSVPFRGPSRGTDALSRDSISSLGSSMGFSSRRSRGQTPDMLSDAFRDFSSISIDKIRVDLDSGPFQQSSWATGMKFSKHKLRDLKDLRQSTTENSIGRSFCSTSRLGTLSQHSSSSLGQGSANSLSWKPMGCSRSNKVLTCMQLRGMTADNYKSISDLTHFLKPIWIEFSPAVAPMPQLIDSAHQATYSMCFEKADYVGCFEVIQSSLGHTSLDQVCEISKIHTCTIWLKGGLCGLFILLN